MRFPVSWFTYLLNRGMAVWEQFSLQKAHLIIFDTLCITGHHDGVSIYTYLSDISLL